MHDQNIDPATNAIDHLLEPSLAEHREVPALYSVRANFLMAFFGGGLAFAVFSGLNSRRLGRLQKDLPWLVVGALFFCALTVWGGTLTVPGASLPFEGDLRANSRIVRAINRGLALLFMGLAYMSHRRFHRAAQIGGGEAPNPWRAALACIAVSIALSVVLAMIGRGIA